MWLFGWNEYVHNFVVDISILGFIINNLELNFIKNSQINDNIVCYYYSMVNESNFLYLYIKTLSTMEMNNNFKVEIQAHLSWRNEILFWYLTYEWKLIHTEIVKIYVFWYIKSYYKYLVLGKFCILGEFIRSWFYARILVVGDALANMNYANYYMYIYNNLFLINILKNLWKIKLLKNFIYFYFLIINIIYIYIIFTIIIFIFYYKFYILFDYYIKSIIEMLNEINLYKEFMIYKKNIFYFYFKIFKKRVNVFSKFLDRVVFKRNKSHLILLNKFYNLNKFKKIYLINEINKENIEKIYVFLFFFGIISQLYILKNLLKYIIFDYLDLIFKIYLYFLKYFENDDIVMYNFISWYKNRKIKSKLKKGIEQRYKNLHYKYAMSFINDIIERKLEERRKERKKVKVELEELYEKYEDLRKKNPYLSLSTFFWHKYSFYYFGLKFLLKSLVKTLRSFNFEEILNTIIDKNIYKIEIFIEIWIFIFNKYLLNIYLMNLYFFYYLFYIFEFIYFVIKKKYLWKIYYFYYKAILYKYFLNLFNFNFYIKIFVKFYKKFLYKDIIFYYFKIIYMYYIRIIFFFIINNILNRFLIIFLSLIFLFFFFNLEYIFSFDNYNIYNIFFKMYYIYYYIIYLYNITNIGIYLLIYYSSSFFKLLLYYFFLESDLNQKLELYNFEYKRMSIYLWRNTYRNIKHFYLLLETLWHKPILLLKFRKRKYWKYLRWHGGKYFKTYVFYYIWYFTISYDIQIYFKKLAVIKIIIIYIYNFIKWFFKFGIKFLIIYIENKYMVIYIYTYIQWFKNIFFYIFIFLLIYFIKIFFLIKKILIIFLNIIFSFKIYELMYIYILLIICDIIYYIYMCVYNIYIYLHINIYDNIIYIYSILIDINELLYKLNIKWLNFFNEFFSQLNLDLNVLKFNKQFYKTFKQCAFFLDSSKIRTYWTLFGNTNNAVMTHYKYYLKIYRMFIYFFLSNKESYENFLLGLNFNQLNIYYILLNMIMYWIYYMFIFFTIIIFSIKFRRIFRDRTSQKVNNFYSWQKLNYLNMDKLNLMEDSFLENFKFNKENSLLMDNYWEKYKFEDEIELYEKLNNFRNYIEKNNKIIFNRLNYKFFSLYNLYLKKRINVYRSNIEIMFYFYIRGIRNRYNFLKNYKYFLPFKYYFNYKMLKFLEKKNIYYKLLNSIDLISLYKINNINFYLYLQMLNKFKKKRRFYELLFNKDKYHLIEMLFFDEKVYEKILSFDNSEFNNVSYLQELILSWEYGDLFFEYPLVKYDLDISLMFDKLFDWLNGIDNYFSRLFNFYIYDYKIDYAKIKTSLILDFMKKSYIETLYDKRYFYTSLEYEAHETNDYLMQQTVLRRIEKMYQVTDEGTYITVSNRINENTANFIPLFSYILMFYWFYIFFYLLVYFWRDEWFLFRYTKDLTTIVPYLYIYVLYIIKYLNIKLFILIFSGTSFQGLIRLMSKPIDITYPYALHDYVRYRSNSYNYLNILYSSKNLLFNEYIFFWYILYIYFAEFSMYNYIYDIIMLLFIDNIFIFSFIIILYIFFILIFNFINGLFNKK